MIPKLPLKFIFLWIINLVVIIALVVILDLRGTMSLRNASAMYLTLGAVLALLEQALFDKLRGE